MISGPNCQILRLQLSRPSSRVPSLEVTFGLKVSPFEDSTQRSMRMGQSLQPEKKKIGIIDGRGYIFDVRTLKYLRSKYHVAGVLSGVLPQFPQQNNFNGLPLQLLPEEVKYLLNTGDFELVDREFQLKNSVLIDAVDTSLPTIVIPAQTEFKEKADQQADLTEFKQPTAERYQVYKYLMDRGYFIMPGLRFGCQFMAYPGDLLRYHSHFNVLGFGWDEKFDILNIVNGGRLATSVKKCWVIGAKEPDNEEGEVYSIEWAGFG